MWVWRSHPFVYHVWHSVYASEILCTFLSRRRTFDVSPPPPPPLSSLLVNGPSSFPSAGLILLSLYVMNGGGRTTERLCLSFAAERPPEIDEQFHGMFMKPLTRILYFSFALHFLK